MEPALRLAESAVRELHDEVGRPSGPAALEVAGAYNEVADLQTAAVLLNEAEQCLSSALHLLDDATDGDPQALRSLRSDTLVRRGHVRRLQGRWAASEADLTAGRAGAADQEHLAGAHNALGILCKDTGDLDRAEQHYRTAERLLTSAHGPNSATLAALEHNLAGLAHARGTPADGLPHILRALALRAAAPGGPDPADVLSDRTVLVALLADSGRHEQAEVIVRELIDAWTALRGPRHYEVGHCRHHLAAILEARGEAAASRAQYDLARNILCEVLGPAHPEVLALGRAR